MVRSKAAVVRFKPPWCVARGAGWHPVYARGAALLVEDRVVGASPVSSLEPHTLTVRLDTSLQLQLLQAPRSVYYCYYYYYHPYYYSYYHCYYCVYYDYYVYYYYVHYYYVYCYYYYYYRRRAPSPCSFGGAAGAG